MTLTLNSPRIVLFAACATLTALALAGGSIAFVLPQMSQADSLRRSIAAAEATLAAASANASSSPSAASRGSAAAELYQLSAAMPATTDMPGILMQLSTLATRSGVSISSIAPGALAAGTSGSQTLPISLALTGKYTAIIRLLTLLREAVVQSSAGLAVHGRLFLVNSLQLTASGASGGNSGSSGASTASHTGAPETLSASLQVDAFVYGTAPSASSTATTTTSTATTSG